MSAGPGKGRCNSYNFLSVEVFLGKVLLALVFRHSGTFPGAGPTVEIFRRDCPYSYARNVLAGTNLVFSFRKEITGRNRKTSTRNISAGTPAAGAG